MKVSVKPSKNIAATIEDATVEIKELIPGQGIEKVVMFKSDAIALAKAILKAYGA